MTALFSGMAASLISCIRVTSVSLIVAGACAFTIAMVKVSDSAISKVFLMICCFIVFLSLQNYSFYGDGDFLSVFPLFDIGDFSFNFV
jgi:ABC-type arginine/histidine transport system permease subunit